MLRNEEGKLLGAVWETSKVPYVGGDVGYYIYEEVPTPGRSEYQYWHHAGLAGCVVKSYLRAKSGLAGLSAAEVARAIFENTTLSTQKPGGNKNDHRE